MDPQRHPPVRNYLSSREQRRLLLLIAALGLVFYLMNEARKPENWRFFANGDATGQVELPRDEEGVSGDRRDESEPIRPLPKFDRSALDAIRDDAPFQNEEQQAWFGLFSILKDADPRRLAKESLGKVSYVQLYDQPNAYRGKLVGLGGVIRRVQFKKAPQNDANIRGYYQAWLNPDDGSENPIVVYILDLPKGFPIGVDVSARVTLTGYFFKRWVYSAADHIRFAPVILAKTVSWTPEARQASSSSASPSSTPPSIIAVVFGALILAGIILFMVYQRTRVKHSIEEVDLSELPLDIAVESDEESTPQEIANARSEEHGEKHLEENNRQ